MGGIVGIGLSTVIWRVVFAYNPARSVVLWMPGREVAKANRLSKVKYRLRNERNLRGFNDYLASKGFWVVRRVAGSKMVESLFLEAVIEAMSEPFLELRPDLHLRSRQSDLISSAGALRPAFFNSLNNRGFEDFRQALRVWFHNYANHTPVYAKLVLTGTVPPSEQAKPLPIIGEDADWLDEWYSSQVASDKNATLEEWGLQPSCHREFEDHKYDLHRISDAAAKEFLYYAKQKLDTYSDEDEWVVLPKGMLPYAELEIPIGSYLLASNWTPVSKFIEDYGFLLNRAGYAVRVKPSGDLYQANDEAERFLRNNTPPKIDSESEFYPSWARR